MPGALPLCACEVVLTTSAPSRTLLEPRRGSMASFVDAAAAGSSSEEEVARSSSEEEEEAGFLDDSALAVTPSAHRRLDWARRSMSRVRCHYGGMEVDSWSGTPSGCGWLVWCDFVKSPPQR